MRLRKLTEVYISERDNSEAYNDHLRRHVRLFCEFAGNVKPKQLEYDQVNEWLAAVSVNHAKATVRTYKQAVVCIWYYASQRGLCAIPNTRRLKRITERHKRPTAFSKDDVRRLIEVAGTIPGTYGPGMEKARYWQALIRGAWDLGFRRGDMLALPRSIVDADKVDWDEHKTGRTQCRRLSDQGRDLLRRISHEELAYPWLRSLAAFAATFRHIRELAQIEAGTFKWLRRSHGSYSGTLGHASSDVFEKHYHDRSLDMKPTGPGEL